MNTFFQSQCNDCPLALMNHSLTNYTNVNKLEEYSLYVMYCDQISVFETKLKNYIFASIHNRNFQFYAIEKHKASEDLSPPLTFVLFEQKQKHHYNLIYLLSYLL